MRARYLSLHFPCARSAARTSMRRVAACMDNNVDAVCMTTATQKSFVQTRVFLMKTRDKYCFEKSK
jgi:hypothetical protein